LFKITYALPDQHPGRASFFESKTKTMNNNSSLLMGLKATDLALQVLTFCVMCYLFVSDDWGPFALFVMSRHSIPIRYPVGIGSKVK
jgi:hypothetical protein